MSTTRTYPADLERIIDGDTVVVTINVGLGVRVYARHIRLYGINAPEHNTPEGQAAIAAITVLFASVSGGYHSGSFGLQLSTDHDDAPDKYGRLLGRITLPGGTCANDWMVANGFAKPYFGEGPKPT